MFRLTVIIITVFLCFTPVLAQQTVLLSVENTPPYIDETSDDKGLFSRQVSRAFALNNINTEFQFMNWLETDALSNKNAPIFSFMWLRTPDFTKKYVFSEPLAKISMVIMSYGKKALKTERLDQLRGLKIGVTNGYSYGKQVDDYTQFLDLTYCRSDYACLRKLKEGLVEFILIEPLLAKSLINSEFKNDKNQFVTYKARYLVTSDVYIACAKTYAGCVNLIRQFNSGLESLNVTAQ